MRGGLAVLSLVVLMASISRAADIVVAGDATSNVLVLTDSNWNTEGPPSRPNDTFLIKFYAPWCGHCRKLEPTWEETATALQTKSTSTVKYVTAKIDVSGAGQQTGALFGVRGFPTLMRFSGDSYHNHKAEPMKERTVDSFVMFAENPQGPAKGMPSGFDQALTQLNPIRFFEAFGQQVQNLVDAYPSVVPVSICIALLMIVGMGVTVGYSWTESRTPYIWIRFPEMVTNKNNFTAFGLASRDPEWEIKDGMALGKRTNEERAKQYYVNKSDPAKHYAIPGSMIFQATKLPPPPPAK